MGINKIGYYKIYIYEYFESFCSIQFGVLENSRQGFSFSFVLKRLSEFTELPVTVKMFSFIINLFFTQCRCDQTDARTVVLICSIFTVRSTLVSKYSTRPVVCTPTRITVTRGAYLHHRIQVCSLLLEEPDIQQTLLCLGLCPSLC